jgi:pSer/pThr/pTyr-binding forkhead associated (FHA) protein
MSIQIILTGLAGREAGRAFIVSGRASCTLGRSRRCTVRLQNDPTVSRQHCLLECDGGVLRVQDLGSKNGTYLNGENIGQRAVRDEEESDDTLVSGPPRVVRSGDYLSIGHNAFLVEIGVDCERGRETPHIPFVSPELTLVN